MDITELDRASTAREATGGDLAFWRCLAAAELFLLLTEEPKGADLRPQVFDLSEGRLVLVFDREDRMAGFAPVPQPYAALPGRVVAALAAGQGLSLGLNLGTGAASETVLPPEALAWLVETLASAPAEEATDRPVEVGAPQLDAQARAAVEHLLARVAGQADEALLADVVWESGRRGTVLAFPGVAEMRQSALARAVAEALALSGLDAAALDVIFPEPASTLTRSLRRQGRRYQARPPEVAPEAAPGSAPKGPGMDPARPPVLK